MSSVGFVGNGTDKFTEKGEHESREIIRAILLGSPWGAMVSGHSPVGGIDIWAEEEALAAGIPLDLKVPEVHQWNPPGRFGYRARNLAIASDSDVLHIIVADVYPEAYVGRRWDSCYHHRPLATDHVKSGGCWTGKEAIKLGTETTWHIVSNY